MRGHLFRRTVLSSFALAAAAYAAADEKSLENRCQAEIVELHEFLEAWSNAELPDTDAAFARFSDALAPSFAIVDPGGSISGREPVVEAIRAAHGRWRLRPGKIRIEAVQLRQAMGDLALVTYEEWHDFGDETQGRLSSVFFGVDESAPNGLVWLHLHETWISEGPTDTAE